jgi:hypothetical protein
MDIWAGAAFAAVNKTVEQRKIAKAGRFTPRLITYIIIATQGWRPGAAIGIFLTHLGILCAACAIS